MKTRMLIVMGLLCFMNIFSESTKTIELKNEFGGLTQEVLYIKGDDSYGVIDVSRFYYDGDKNIKKIIHKLALDKINETGIVFQEQEYRGTKIVAYKMYMSDAAKLKCGYDYIIEIIGENDEIVSCGYGFGNKLIKEDTDTFAYKYPFYKLSYLFNLIYENYQPPKKGDEVTVNSKYFKGRSLVTFITDIEPMTKKDKEIAGYFFSTFKANGEQVYNSKITISEGGKQYTMFVQDELKQYIKKSHQALVTFVVVGFNHTLYPLMTALIEAD